MVWYSVEMILGIVAVSIPIFGFAWIGYDWVLHAFQRDAADLPDRVPCFELILGGMFEYIWPIAPKYRVVPSRENSQLYEVQAFYGGRWVPIKLYDPGTDFIYGKTRRGMWLILNFYYHEANEIPTKIIQWHLRHNPIVRTDWQQSWVEQYNVGELI